MRQIQHLEQKDIIQGRESEVAEEKEGGTYGKGGNGMQVGVCGTY